MRLIFDIVTAFVLGGGLRWLEVFFGVPLGISFLVVIVASLCLADFSRRVSRSLLLMFSLVFLRVVVDVAHFVVGNHSWNLLRIYDGYLVLTFVLFLYWRKRTGFARARILYWSLAFVYLGCALELLLPEIKVIFLAGVQETARMSEFYLSQQGVRLSGGYPNCNTLAYVITLLIGLLLHNKSKPFTGVEWLCLLPSAPFLILTGSRTSIVIYAILLFTYAVRRLRNASIALVGVPTLIGSLLWLSLSIEGVSDRIWIDYGTDKSLATRLEVIGQYSSLAVKSPLIGSGFVRAELIEEGELANASQNQLLELALSNGYILVLLCIFTCLYFGYKKGGFLLMFILGLYCMSLNFLFLHPVTMFLFAWLDGITCDIEE